MRKNVALTILDVIPTLWIWDNVEPINGFPMGTTSKWTEAEQKELKEFMKAAQETKAKFLLTSRRDERIWLGDLPRRVSLPPMPMQEMVQLARALAEKQGRRITDVEDWRPLLNFTKGNPLTINVIVGQALRDGITTQAKINDYVQKLRSGETAFTDETSEGRSKSLGASLSYGFETAFSEDERKVLALLHFFQGFVEVFALRIMLGDPAVFIEKTDWPLTGLLHLTPDTPTLDTLLTKASEIGLLTPHGDGYYTIHPALPWFFKSLFDQYYPESDDRPLTVDGENTVNGPSSTVALRSFVEALGELGNYYQSQYEGGNRNVIAALRAEEANLLHARALARTHEWWMAIIKTMQGLHTLYDHTGRRAEWQRLVEEIVPDFAEAETFDPIPGREDQWRLVIEYLARLAMGSREWGKAELYMRKKVEFAQSRAAALLARSPETLGANEKNTLRTLAVSIEQLGHIQREQGKPECAETYQESFALDQQIGDNSTAAVAAFNLGRAYTDLPALRDLDAAEGWYQRSLELRAKNDRKGQGTSYDALGNVAYQKFLEAKKANKSETLLTDLLNKAIATYYKALDLTPPDAVADLAVTHNQLGNIYDDAGDLERALEHYNQAAKFFEAAGDLFHAGQVQFNVAVTIANKNRLSDALLYARAALRNFEPYGQGAAEDIENTKGLIGEIERVMKK